MMKLPYTFIHHHLMHLWITVLLQKGALGACKELCTQFDHRDCDNKGVIFVSSTHVFYCGEEKGYLCVCPCVISPQLCAEVDIKLQEPLYGPKEETRPAENHEWGSSSLLNSQVQSSSLLNSQVQSSSLFNSQVLWYLKGVKNTNVKVNFVSILHEQSRHHENKGKLSDAIYSGDVVYKTRTLLGSDAEPKEEEEPDQGHVNQKQKSRPLHYTGPARGPLPRAGAFSLDDDWKPRHKTKLLNDPSPFPGSAIAVLVLLVIILLLVIALTFYS